MNAREVLEAGLSELEARPWTRGKEYNADTGGVCAYGALGLAVKGRVWKDLVQVSSETREGGYDEAANLLNKVVLPLTVTSGTGADWLAYYNDYVATSKEDVIDRFREAIKLAIEIEEEA